MPFEMPKTRDEFLSRSPIDRIVAISYVLNECADKCKGNILVGGTWVEDSFRVAASDLYDAALHASVEAELRAIRPDKP